MLEEEIAALWKARQQEIQRLRFYGAPGVFRPTPHIELAFDSHQERALTCIDGGIPYGLHLAGSGVLLDQDQRQKAIRAADIEVVTTHDDCGAFRKAYPDCRDHDASARQWGQGLARAVGLPHRHIPMAEMDRLAGFHDEVCVYVDATGCFSRIPGLPKGFIVSLAAFSATAFADTELAIEIAFGPHGFGERFCAEWPFYVILLGGGRNPYFDCWLEEVSRLCCRYGRRVQQSVLR